jgi:RNA-directed DNA polymerase
VLSPLLANLYLHPLDLLMEQSGYRMVRYADDCVPRRH